MTIANSIRRYMADQGVEYDVLKHPLTWSASQTAQASHISGKCIAKGVVLKDDKGFLLAVLPASYQIRFEALWKMVHRELELATETEAESLFTDCERGAVPPLGAAYGLEVIIDDGLIGQKEIFFEGGDHASLLHLKAKNFEHLMAQAQHGDFCRPF